jgi:hypothetical protein
MNCSFQIEQKEINEDDPWSGILATVMYAKEQRTTLPLKLHQHNWYLVEMPFSIQNSKQIGDSLASENILNQFTKW